MKLRMAFAALHEKDHFAELVGESFTGQPGGKPAAKRGPKPRFTAAADICFTPGQLERIAQIAAQRKVSRNAVVREAVEMLFSHLDGQAAQ